MQTVGPYYEPSMDPRSVSVIHCIYMYIKTCIIYKLGAVLQSPAIQERQGQGAQPRGRYFEPTVELGLTLLTTTIYTHITSLRGHNCTQQTQTKALAYIMLGPKVPALGLSSMTKLGIGTSVTGHPPGAQYGWWCTWPVQKERAGTPR